MTAALAYKELRESAWIAALGLAGMALWARMLQHVADGWALIIDLDRWADPVVGAWRRVLPDYRDEDAATWVLQAVWLVMLALTALWAWRTAPCDGDPDPAVADEVSRR